MGVWGGVTYAGRITTRSAFLFKLVVGVSYSLLSQRVSTGLSMLNAADPAVFGNLIPVQGTHCRN